MDNGRFQIVAMDTDNCNRFRYVTLFNSWLTYYCVQYKMWHKAHRCCYRALATIRENKTNTADLKTRK